MTRESSMGRTGILSPQHGGVTKSSEVSGSYGLIMKFIVEKVMVGGIVINVLNLLRLNTIKKNVIFVGTGMVVDVIALSAEFIALNVVDPLIYKENDVKSAFPIFLVYLFTC